MILVKYQLLKKFDKHSLEEVSIVDVAEEGDGVCQHPNISTPAIVVRFRPSSILVSHCQYLVLLPFRVRRFVQRVRVKTCEKNERIPCLHHTKSLLTIIFFYFIILFHYINNNYFFSSTVRIIYRNLISLHRLINYNHLQSSAMIDYRVKYPFIDNISIILRQLYPIHNNKIVVFAGYKEDHRQKNRREIHLGRKHGLKYIKTGRNWMGNGCESLGLRRTPSTFEPLCMLFDKEGTYREFVLENCVSQE